MPPICTRLHRSPGAAGSRPRPAPAAAGAQGARWWPGRARGPGNLTAGGRHGQPPAGRRRPGAGRV